jgi:hypothetical protein
VHVEGAKQYVTAAPPLFEIGLFGLNPSVLELSSVPAITPVAGVKVAAPLLYDGPVVGASAPKKYGPEIDAVPNGPVCCSKKPEATELLGSTTKPRVGLTK